MDPRMQPGRDAPRPTRRDDEEILSEPTGGSIRPWMENPEPTVDQATVPTAAEKRGRMPIYVLTGAITVAFVVAVVALSIFLLR